MTEAREGAIPPELYSNLVLATGSVYNASRALSGTINIYSAMPVVQQRTTLQYLVNKVQPLSESRVSADLYFRRRFRRGLFSSAVDDAKAVLDMSSRCTDERDFVLKVQALSTFTTRFNRGLKNLIASVPIRQRIRGSINILETILNENFAHYDAEIIANLRKANTLRSQMYPTHVITPQAVEVLEEMGFHYPPNDWNEVWERILELCNDSLRKLTQLLTNP
jgi:hypothetical protein